MTTKEYVECLRRAGAVIPADVSVNGSAEHVKNVRRKVVDSICFRSTLEADCYQVLKSWQRAGVIKALECQPVFILQAPMRREGKTIRAIKYIADFAYTRDGERIVVDAKGFRLPVYQIKRKMFMATYPDIQFAEWTREYLRSIS